MTGVLVYEATNRIRNPEDVDGKLMFFIALMGLCVNIIMGVILHQGGHTHSHGLGGAGGHDHSHGPPKKKINAKKPSGYGSDGKYVVCWFLIPTFSYQFPPSVDRFPFVSVV
jgi:hypothetical protein